MKIALSADPGLIRNGSLLPFVTSRMKKLASLAATSKLWAVKPLEPSWASRSVGVLPVTTWTSTLGVSVPIPTRPALLTVSALARAPAATRKTWRPAVPSSTAKYSAPPLLLSLMMIRQSFFGKLPVELVSLKWIRTLFSFRRTVSNPKFSPLTQSLPTHRLKAMMTSSRCWMSSSGEATAWPLRTSMVPVRALASAGSSASGIVAARTSRYS